MSQRWYASLALAWGALACNGASAPTPDAAFLLAAGDSTFLVQASAGESVIRRSPLLLAWIDSAFHEVYVIDEDLSFDNAVFVGQRVYRRNLLTGDSTLVHYDSTIRRLALEWQREHPDAAPLGPDDELTADPLIEASTDMELLDAVGPFLSYQFHLDVETELPAHRHAVRRGVVDLRDGKPTDLAMITDAADAARVVSAAHRAFASAVDSVSRATGEVAERARRALRGFEFDSLSFDLDIIDGEPTVSFLVPGSGLDAGGYSLPLPAIALRPAPWLEAMRPTLPERSSTSAVRWRDSSYEVHANVDSTGVTALVTLRRGSDSRAVTRIPLPVRRMYRLTDPAWRGALERAFAEFESSGDVRTASLTRRPRIKGQLTSTTMSFSR